MDLKGVKDELNHQMANDSNMLVLTGKKGNKSEEKKDDKNAKEIKKRLTKKEKIRLEKIVDRKNKSSKVKYKNCFYFICIKSLKLNLIEIKRDRNY